MDWKTVITGESFENWIDTRLTPHAIIQGQRLDPFATSMRDFKAASDNLIAVDDGDALPDRGGAGNQARTDLAFAGLVTQGQDPVQFTTLGKAVLIEWQRLEVSNNSPEDELARCVIVASLGIAQKIPLYCKINEFWQEIVEAGVSFHDAVQNPEFLYLASFLNSEVNGFNPWTVARDSSLEIKAATVADINSIKGRFPHKAELLDKLSTRVGDWASRSSGRKIFCTALELIHRERPAQSVLLSELLESPTDYIGTFDKDKVQRSLNYKASMDLGRLVGCFMSDLEKGNLRIPDELFLRFASALGSKRFLILSGLAGSGKTKLAQAFGRWFTPVSDSDVHDACVVVPVGADWTGTDAVLGYPDGLDSKRYVTRPSLDLIQRAMVTEGDGTPHILILDEMNLSHVERYFADLLSLIESGDTTRLYQPEKDEDGNVCFRSEVDPVLRLPTNLFIIGTVNVDETTYMFSPKVLDRANVIEFRVDRDDLKDFLKKPRTPDLDAFTELGKNFGPAFVAESCEPLSVPSGVADVFEEEMMLFFELLAEHNAEFGFRVGNEAARFMHFYQVLADKEEASEEWFDAAMDAIIVQKLLPKLHGSRTKLEGLLWSLAYACGAERGEDASAFLTECRKAGKAEDENTHSPESVYAAMQAKDANNPLASAKYSLSFEKILRMYRKLIRDQFVTFSEA